MTPSFQGKCILEEDLDEFVDKTGRIGAKLIVAEVGLLITVVGNAIVMAALGNNFARRPGFDPRSINGC